MDPKKETTLSNKGLFLELFSNYLRTKQFKHFELNNFFYWRLFVLRQVKHFFCFYKANN